MALDLSLVSGKDHIRKKEYPIRRYNSVHTGPNTLFGGLNDGCRSVEYHSGIASAVKKPATPPHKSGINREISNRAIGDFIDKCTDTDGSCLQKQPNLKDFFNRIFCRNGNIFNFHS